MTPLFELDRVSRWYGDVIALNRVSIRVSPGVIGVLGPNGAGKTTLLRLLTGQIRPSQGSVKALGLTPFANPTFFRKVGVLPDVEALPERLTGLGFLRAIAELNGLDPKGAGDRAGQTLAQVGLTEAAERRIGGYSKGMRQRLRLAQAILHEPELLVLDEPLSGLDPVARMEVSELIRGWGKKGGSVVVSSHILREVELMTRHVLLVVDGRLRAEGELEEIRDLIDSEPRRISVRTPEVKAIAAELLREAYVVGVQFLDDGETLVISTTRAAEVFRSLPRIALDKGIRIHSIHADDEDLESVFGYLVKRP